LKKDEAQRLKALGQQNGRLKKIVAEQALDISLLKDLQRGKLVSPARRRDAVRFLVKRRRISGRRACRVVGQHRSSQRYRRLEPEYERRLVARAYTSSPPPIPATATAASGRCCGARASGSTASGSSASGAWEGNRVPPPAPQASGRKAQGAAANAPWNLAASGPNQIWSYDFTAARTRTGALLRILNVVDEYTRVALGCRVDRSIGAAEVIGELERLFARPRLLRSDNGRARPAMEPES
jgi:putative transposase